MLGITGLSGKAGMLEAEGASFWSSDAGAGAVAAGEATEGQWNSAGAESHTVAVAGAQGAQGTEAAHGAGVSQAGTTTHLGSQSTTEQASAAGLHPSRCSSLSIQRPAETGVNVMSVHSVATNASRTQYVNGLDMNPTPLLNSLM